MKAVVLFSGGLDSTTALYQAMRDGSEKTLPLLFSYGSLHNHMEAIAADRIASALGLRVEHFTLPRAIFKGGNSALLGESEVPDADYVVAAEGPSVTFVPNRNAVFISAAVAIAQARGYDMVYMGMHASDHTNWAYPDCSPEFLGAMANAVWVATSGTVRLVFPFVWMTKAQIVKRAASLHVPVYNTWSCYKGGYKHCGTCPTCRERIDAFIEAGYLDPVGYLKDVTWLKDVKSWTVMEEPNV
jgi:7-cyano-7-deazaguanine synthase